jgi:hypothetical protein
VLALRVRHHYQGFGAVLSALTHPTNTYFYSKIKPDSYITHLYIYLMTVNRQQSTVNDHQECLYTLDAHQAYSNFISGISWRVPMPKFLGESDRPSNKAIISRN